MIRAAGPADAEAVEAFLLRHVAGAMFPLSNLRLHGLGDGDFAGGHNHAMRVWWVGRGVLGVSRGGMIMPMLPDGPVPGLAATLTGMMVTGAIGPAAQVRAVLGVLGLADRRRAFDSDEPGFGLDLSDLRVPDAKGLALVPLGDAHVALMQDWQAAYRIETLGAAPAEAAAQAAEAVAAYRAGDNYRVLVLDGVPVAFTGFNARLPEIVQIGGVYVPPASRNRGFARLAVALHLLEARTAGVKRAVLFAANAAAARAYAGIGFQAADPVAVVLFDGAQRVDA